MLLIIDEDYGSVLMSKDVEMVLSSEVAETHLTGNLFFRENEVTNILKANSLRKKLLIEECFLYFYSCCMVAFTLEKLIISVTWHT